MSRRASRRYTKVNASEATTVKVPVDLDLSALRDKVRAAVEKSLPPDANGYTPWFDICELTIDHVVYDLNGDCWQIDYTIDANNNIQLGPAVKVKAEFVAAEGATPGEPKPASRSVHNAILSETFKGEIRAAESEMTAKPASEKGWTWECTLLREGLGNSPNVNMAAFGMPGKSGVRNYTREAVAGAAEAKLFEGAPMMVRSVEDHLAFSNNPNKSSLHINDEAQQIGGTFRACEAREIDGKMYDVAKLDLRRNAVGTATRDFLLERAAEGHAIPYDLSWTGKHDFTIRDPNADIPIIDVTKIHEVISVDAVDKGNAGGHIMHAAEAQLTLPTKPRKMDKTLLKVKARLIARAAEADVAGAEDASPSGAMASTLIDYACDFIWKYLPGVQDIYDSEDDLKALDEAKLVKLFRKADAAADAGASTKGNPKGGDAGAGAGDNAGSDANASEAMKRIKALEEKLTQSESKNLSAYFERSLTAAAAEGVHDSFVQMIRNQQKNSAFASESQIDAAIQYAKEASAKIRPLHMPLINATTDERDKMQRCVMNFWYKGASSAEAEIAKEKLGYNPQDEKYNAFRSLKNMFEQIMGIGDIGSKGFGLDLTGRASEAYDPSISSELALNALNIRAYTAWKTPTFLDDIYKITKAVPMQNFLASDTQNYGYFPTSGITEITDQDADYPELTLTGVEDISLTLKDWGNVFYIGWRDVVNDRVQQVRELPFKLMVAHKTKLYKDVFDLLINSFSATWSPDSKAIVSADHKNLIGTGNTNGTLTYDHVLLGFQQMIKMQQLGSNDPLGLAPKYLIYQVEDEDQAKILTTPMQGEKNMTANTVQSFELDRIRVPYWSNTAHRQWFLMPDPSLAECIVIQYFDTLQQPEIVQEALNSGKNFTANKLGYRVHFPHNVGMTSYRPLQGAQIS